MADNKSRKAFPLRISARLFASLRDWAGQDLRSINGQIEFLLAEAVRKRSRDARDDSANSGQQAISRDDEPDPPS
jgi:hypothetical protein